MKNNNNGFTLVELLAVICLLVIILVVSYPNYLSLTNNAMSKYDNGIMILVKNAAEMYVNNNKEDVNNYFQFNDVYCLPIAKLAAYNYIDSDLKNSKNESINMKRCVNVTKVQEDGNTKYNYELVETEVSDTVDYIPPIISITTKEGSSVPCNFSNIVSSKEEYLNRCEIVVTDDKDINVQTTQVEKKVNNNILITYNAVDSSGNKAIPLKIKLIIN